MTLDALTCRDHGWFGHFGIHEAGHATAAVLLDFDFVDVTIYPGDQVYRQMVLGEEVVGAGVTMPTDRPSDWFSGREEDALVYVLVGSLAEDVVIGHHLTGGYNGDMDVWRRGTGRTASQDPTELGPVLHVGVARARKFVSVNLAAILRVYQLMTDRVPHDGTRHEGFDGPLVITSDEVRAVVLAST